MGGGLQIPGTRQEARQKGLTAGQGSGNEVAELPKEVLRFVTKFYDICLRVGAHWSGNEVAELPKEVLRFVAEFYDICLRVGESSKAWRKSRQIHLPKEGLKGRGPLLLRNSDPSPFLARGAGRGVRPCSKSNSPRNGLRAGGYLKLRGVRRASV